MNGGRRIVVFTADLSYAVRKGIVEIDDAMGPGALFWLVVLHPPRKSLAQLARSQWLNLRRNGWRWIPYQFSDLLDRAIVRWSPSVPPASDSPGFEFSTEALSGRANLR